MTRVDDNKSTIKCIFTAMFQTIIRNLILASLFFSSFSFASYTLEEAALERLKYRIDYDPKYVRIAYPGGDVPANTGVCTDVVIRSYRKLGIDLQELVHEDMRTNFDKYPSKRVWGLNKPDSNIDHRRVLNLRIFFKRNGMELPVSSDGRDYEPGEIITWMIPGNLPHVGIVTSKKSADGKRPLIVHNIGEGPELEDILFDYKITGRFKY